jgi:hypothetical protein
MTRCNKLIILSLAVLTILIVFSALAIKRNSWLVTSTEKATAPCVVRLMVIDGCKQQWAAENNKTTNDVPTWENIRPYLPSGWTNSYWANGKAICPENGTYTIERVGEPPTCSIGGPKHSIPK